MMHSIITQRERGRKYWLLWLFCLVAWATTASAQQGEKGKDISCKFDNERLSEALRKVERLSEYYKVQFAYEDVEHYRVTASFRQAKAPEAVNRLLQNTGLTSEVEGRFIRVYSLKSTKRKNAVSGVVRDEEGEPLVGVAVRNKSSKRGTVTDIDGRFTLPTTAESVELTFTFIGKKEQTRKVHNGSAIQITMADDAKVMDDVVVTGYQSIDRRHLTSAVTSVKMEDLQLPGVTDLNKMLEGKIPDMVVSSNSGEINATPRLRIRGTSTIIGNREPLWVVDGIIVNDPVNLSPDVLNDPDYVNRIGNAISGINPQDIERLDVLKDAAATALYGTRAANGVIVITTKKGRSGKPVVSYSANATFRQRPRYTDSKIDLMNSKERIEFSQHLVDIHYRYPDGMPKVGYESALGDLYAGKITQEQFISEVNQMQTRNTDWFSILMHDSFSQDHGVNVSGGSDKVRYYASLGYTNEDDVVNGSNNKRYTATGKIDIIFSDKVRLAFNLSGNMSNRKYPQSSINPTNYAYNTSRAISAYNADGSYAFYKKNAGARDGASIGYLNYNIMNELDNSYQKQTTNGFTVSSNLRYTPVESFFLDAIFSTYFSNAELEGWWGEKTYYAADLRRADYGETPAQPKLSAMPYGGEMSKQDTHNKSYTARFQANYNKYFGDDKQHYVNVVLGGEANSNRYGSYSKTERGYFLDRGKSFMSDIDASYTTYTKWLLQNTPHITDSKTNLLSAYATASYGFRDYFTVNANTRYDGSNKFGNRSNEKILPVWSVSGNANLSSIFKLDEEHEWLDMITMKASYGEQGNMLDGQTPVLVIKKGSLSSYYNELYSTTSSFANPDLRWEKTHSANVGLEASFLGGRIAVELEYYYKKTTDAFMDKTISDVNGYKSYVVNSGTVTNRGYNVNLTTVPVKTNAFRWILSGSLSKIENEMQTAPGTETYELSDFLNGTAIVKGQPVGTFYSYKFLGLNPLNGGPIFDDGEERQSELANMSKYDVYTSILTPSGQRTPDYTGSINNTLTYKDWRLNIGLYYSLGASTRLFRVFKDFMSGYSAEMNMNRELLNAWRVPGDEMKTNIPAIMGRGSNGFYSYNDHWSNSGTTYSGPVIGYNSWEMYDYSNIRVVSADYLKIQSVSLTYEVPKRILNNYKLQRLAVTMGATNLYTFCDKKLKGQTPTQGGFTEVQLSDIPSYTLGLTLNF